MPFPKKLVITTYPYKTAIATNAPFVVANGQAYDKTAAQIVNGIITFIAPGHFKDVRGRYDDIRVVTYQIYLRAARH